MNFFNFLTQVTSEIVSESSQNQSVASSEGVAQPETTSGFNWEGLLHDVVTWFTTSGIKIIIGLLIIFIGFKIVNAFARHIKKKLEMRHTDPMIVMVVNFAVKKGLKLLILLGVITYMGIDTAGIAVVISSLGVGVSLAVQGSLSNLAGGIVIILMKPFNIGDYIEAQGCSGTVEEIKIFYTYLVTPDNKVQMIPNGSLANGVIVNYSMKNTRRVDLVFSVSYDSDTEKAKNVILDTVNQNELVFKTPNPFVAIGEYSASSIDIYCRVWVKNEDYWNVFFELKDKIGHALESNGISIPYPQMDVHVKEIANK